MKAMVLTGIRQMEMTEVPEPLLESDTDVLLRVDVVGVCGSDVHYYNTGRIGSQVVKYPYRVGHEFAATVLETGKGVRNLRPGDRVAVEPAMSCGQCDQCRAHRRHTCRRLRFLGCPGQAEGCLSERIVMPAECCFPVPASLTSEDAALVEPLSIGWYASKLFSPMAGAAVGILGCGPIGLSVLLAARAAGAARVCCTDRIDARLMVAQRAGAGWTGNPASLDVTAAVRGREPLLLDAVFECCGQQEALDQALTLLKPGGTLLVVGIPTVDRVSFSIDELRRREIRIQNVRRQNECMQPAIDALTSGQIRAGFMVTHRFGFAQSKAAFDLVASYDDGVVKAMIAVAEFR
jgi:L-iditol 2-dehydrogenase